MRLGNKLLSLYEWEFEALKEYSERNEDSSNCKSKCHSSNSKNHNKNNDFFLFIGIKKLFDMIKCCKNFENIKFFKI